MDIPLALALFLGGLATLVVGGDGMVRGAATGARILGISPLVVGLTIVAFGTSAPELAVSLTSGLADSAALAIGNVVGSNIFNIWLILGVAALLQKLPVPARMIRVDLPVLAFASLALAALAWDGVLSALDGALLSIGLIAYIGQTVWAAQRERSSRSTADLAHAEQDEIEREEALSRVDLALVFGGVAMIGGAAALGAFGIVQTVVLVAGVTVVMASTAVAAAGKRPVLTAILMMVAGLAVIVFAADAMVTGAVAMARSLGVSETVIGLTIVAAGTSLPELVTTFAAARQGEADIAVGNVVGSNVFNILCICGVTASIVPLPVTTEVRDFDLAIAVASSLMLWPLAHWRREVSRSAGIGMIVAFVAYMAAVVLRA